MLDELEGYESVGASPNALFCVYAEPFPLASLGVRQLNRPSGVELVL